MKLRKILGAWCGAAALLLAGCHPAVPEGALVLTQTPIGDPPPIATTVLDARYAAGSRVVLLAPPFRPEDTRELSVGLVAAGDPCVSWDGRWVYFAGKSSATADWQIYRTAAAGGSPEQLTEMSGGAMDPAVAAHGELVFSSPVPKAGQLWTAAEPPALYAQMPDRSVRRLTYGPDGAIGATVLHDGRILFVTAQPRDNRHASRHLGLFTINNDGTEVSAYAGEQDSGIFLRRPRELADGRIAYLTLRRESPGSMDRAESVRSAAPFLTRGPLLGFSADGCRSVESLPSRDLLVCAESRSMIGRMMAGNSAVYRLAPDATSLGAPLFNDPRWNSLEAMPVAAREEPAGHTTAVMPAKSEGTMVCLNVNDSRDPPATGANAPAARLRVFALIGSGPPQTLGTVPVAADGSVLVYLPVKVPLGFDTLDAQGRVLRHQPPFVWLQPGENRGCEGCHELPNHAPRNVRPLAVQANPARLDLPAQPGAPRASTP